MTIIERYHSSKMANGAYPSGDLTMRLLVTLVTVLVAVPAAAQSTFVGASLVGDIARFSKVETGSGIANSSSPDGETLGLGVSIGRALGERWGVAFEFVRSGELETRQSLGYAIPASRGSSTSFFEWSSNSSSVTVPPIPPRVPPIPNFPYEIEIEQQYTTFSALAWAKQDIGDHVELSYLGGVTFSRSEIERESGIIDPRLSILPTLPILPILPTETTSIDYRVGPVVGMDANFKVSEHAAVVTGLRLHAINVNGQHGWLIRPAAGLRWKF